MNVQLGSTETTRTGGTDGGDDGSEAGGDGGRSLGYVTDIAYGRGVWFFSRIGKDLPKVSRIVPMSNLVQKTVWYFIGPECVQVRLTIHFYASFKSL